MNLECTLTGNWMFKGFGKWGTMGVYNRMRGEGEKAELDTLISLRGWPSYKQMNYLHGRHMPSNFPEMNNCVHVKKMIKFWKVEKSTRWTMMPYFNVILHIFHREKINDPCHTWTLSAPPNRWSCPVYENAWLLPHEPERI